MTKRGLIGLASAALLLGTTLASQALEVNLGGVSVSAGSGGGGGTSVSVGGGGGTAASATLGGGSNIASTGIGTGGNALNLGIGGASGPLVTTNQDGGTTSANVNLGLGDAGLGDLQDLFNDLTGTAGDTLDGVDVGDLVGAAGLQLAFASLSSGQQQFLRLRCRAGLSSPEAFDKSTVALCRLIAQL